MAELKGTKTEKNLWEAFAGESQARNKYTFFASAAKKEGFEQIAAFFLETAEQEKEHAKLHLKALGAIGDTIANLKTAAAGEGDEWTSMYPSMAKQAQEDGFPEIARVFEGIGKVEKRHQERYKALLKNIEEKKVSKNRTRFSGYAGTAGMCTRGRMLPANAPSASTRNRILKSCPPTTERAFALHGTRIHGGDNLHHGCIVFGDFQRTRGFFTGNSTQSEEKILPGHPALHLPIAIKKTGNPVRVGGGNGKQTAELGKKSGAKCFKFIEKPSKKAAGFGGVARGVKLEEGKGQPLRVMQEQQGDQAADPRQVRLK